MVVWGALLEYYPPCVLPKDANDKRAYSFHIFELWKFLELSLQIIFECAHVQGFVDLLITTTMPHVAMFSRVIKNIEIDLFKTWEKISSPRGILDWLAGAKTLFESLGWRKIRRMPCPGREAKLKAKAKSGGSTRVPKPMSTDTDQRGSRPEGNACTPNDIKAVMDSSAETTPKSKSMRSYRGPEIATYSRQQHFRARRFTGSRVYSIS